MKGKRFLILFSTRLAIILVGIFNWGCNAAIHQGSNGNRSDYSNTDTLYAARLKPFGRYILTEQKKLELISSAVHFGFSFKGTQCEVFASASDAQNHGFIQYELDGVYQKRLRVDGNSSLPLIIKAPAPGTHTVWIYKATEAGSGAIYISKIGGAGIRALTVTKAPIIEFIGNSITCGAAADTSEATCGAGAYQDYTNAYMAYGPRVARALGANYILSSVSGIGIYRTWNKDSPSMPQVYENTDLQAGSTLKWNFSTYSPEVVSIALGTNDLSNGDGKTVRKPFDEQIFTRKFTSFIKVIKQKYPQAQIALLSSPMVKGSNRELLEKCLTNIKSAINTAYPADKPVQTFFFQPMDAQGCAGHPSVAQHGVLAEQLRPFFQQLLK